MKERRSNPPVRAQHRSWENWRMRFDDAVDASPPSLAPQEIRTTEEDWLLSTTRGRLKLDVEQMTVADWSKLLIQVFEHKRRDEQALSQRDSPRARRHRKHTCCVASSSSRRARSEIAREMKTCLCQVSARAWKGLVGLATEWKTRSRLSPYYYRPCV